MGLFLAGLLLLLRFGLRLLLLLAFEGLFLVGLFLVGLFLVGLFLVGLFLVGLRFLPGLFAGLLRGLAARFGLRLRLRLRLRTDPALMRFKFNRIDSEPTCKQITCE